MSIETEAGVHRFTIGEIACTIISDGSNAYHEPAALMFANAPRRHPSPRSLETA